MGKTSYSGSRKKRRSRRLLLELSWRRDPEALMELADEAMRVMEGSRDEAVEEYARGQLVMSYVICKYWLFFMPPYVEVEYVFESQKYADEFAEKVGRFMDVEKATRTIDDREYPSVRLDWLRWNALRETFNAPAHPLDIIAENFVNEKNSRRAFKRLVRDLVLFAATTDVHIDFTEKQ
ncbi:MAG: hypothetical protein QXM43_00920 [Desulfurococcaceae archaeon]